MFIDSNVFLYAISSGGKKEEKCKEFMDKIAKGEQHSTTSVLVLDEVAWVLLGKYGRAAALKAWDRMMGIPNLKIVDINASVARLAPEFLEQGLDPRDAIHAATMKAHGVETILSYDKHFDSVKGISRQTP